MSALVEASSSVDSAVCKEAPVFKPLAILFRSSDLLDDKPHGGVRPGAVLLLGEGCVFRSCSAISHDPRVALSRGGAVAVLLARYLQGSFLASHLEQLGLVKSHRVLARMHV